jgi:hypothetical protein
MSNITSINTRTYLITDNVTGNTVFAINQTEAIITGVWNATPIASAYIGVHGHAGADITSGTVDFARLGTGGGGSSKFLREDNTWQNVTIAPGGADTQIQFNDGGVIAGDADLTWNKTTNVMNFASGAGITWNADSGIKRSAAGVVEINNGTGGTYADLLSKSIILDGAPPAAAAGRVSIGGDVRTTIGGNGAASALTANPLGYLDINVAGTAAQIPYYSRGA